jgi:hypothetical protein
VPAGAGAIIVSNRLAAIIKFASVLTTDSRNGANCPGAPIGVFPSESANRADHRGSRSDLLQTEVDPFGRHLWLCTRRTQAQ